MQDLSGLKVGFFGTPEFSLKFLETLYKNNAEIVFIVSQPASISGRGKKLNHSPVEKWGLQKNIKTLTPKKLNDLEFRKKIKEKNVDFNIVVAYGNLIDDYIINLPKYLTINVHASLLPKWRGAAPIQRSILNGDKETGISIMKVVKKLDAGPVIEKERIKISLIDNASSIYNKMILVGNNLLVETLKNILNKSFNLEIQNEKEVTYAHKIKKNESRINWNEKAEIINLQIRAFNPYPGAWTLNQDESKRIKILESEVIKKEKVLKLVNGFVDKDLIVKCGKDYLKIKKLQPEGKKVLDATEFINGNQFENLYFV